MSQFKQDNIDELHDLLSDLPEAEGHRILSKLTSSELIVLKKAIESAINSAVNAAVSELNELTT